MCQEPTEWQVVREIGVGKSTVLDMWNVDAAALEALTFTGLCYLNFDISVTLN